MPLPTIAGLKLMAVKTPRKPKCHFELWADKGSPLAELDLRLCAERGRNGFTTAHGDRELNGVNDAERRECLAALGVTLDEAQAMARAAYADHLNPVALRILGQPH